MHLPGRHLGEHQRQGGFYTWHTRGRQRVRLAFFLSGMWSMICRDDVNNAVLAVPAKGQARFRERVPVDSFAP